MRSPRKPARRRSTNTSSRAPDIASSSNGAGRGRTIEQDDTTITRGLPNVFEDLGFDRLEAENLRLRSDLMIEVEKVIRQRGLTQARAAKLMGVTQPRLSDLVRGKIERFSIDSLVEMLARAGLRVEATVSETDIPARRRHKVKRP